MSNKAVYNCCVLLALYIVLIGHSVQSARTEEPEKIDATPVLRRQNAFKHPQLQLSDDDASLEMAVRQSLLDYAVDKGLDILTQKVFNIDLPNFTTTAQLPLIGGINVEASNIRFQNFSVPDGAVAVSIESGFYHLRSYGVKAQVSFDWGWDKGILSGSGYGDLRLTDGAIDMIFTVKTETKGIPHVQTATASFSFDSLDLDVHSYSFDWLYQALLFLFSGTIKDNIEGHVHDALLNDVPVAINDVLDTLPAQVSVQGLPFQTVFTYALYTLNYVLVKGYGQVQAAPRDGSTGTSADLVACPFPVTPLDLPPADISGEPHMGSLYMHENVLNCIFWGLFEANSLAITVSDGQVPGVRLVTDLFGMLMPELPKQYPHKGISLALAALSPPKVEFTKAAGVTISAEYSTKIAVLDAAGDGQELQVAELRATLTVNADLNWNTTTIKSVEASYSNVSASTAVNLQGWNMMMPWVIKTFGNKLTMQQLMQQYVQTPASPYVQLKATDCKTFDSWYAVSTDLELVKLPISKLQAAQSKAPRRVHVPSTGTPRRTRV